MKMRPVVVVAAAMFSGGAQGPVWGQGPSYPVVGTNQRQCYDENGHPGCGNGPAGQNAEHPGRVPQYRDNGDGTVSDLVTGLMWEKSFSLSDWDDSGRKAKNARTGGYDDWRVPTIKELYSLMEFSGASGAAMPSRNGAPSDARPYLDNSVFAFEYPAQGRYIDAQYISATAYRGQTMGHDDSFFGVNFADGRIKAYPQDGGPGRRQWYLRLVRGNGAYGRNDFVDDGDGTVLDRATGLTWSKSDSGHGMDWAAALAYCRGQSVAGHQDWRLPDAKELQSIVDYQRSPSATDSAALAPIFQITAIRNEGGERDWPYFWTSTSHLDGRRPGDFAVYIAFGRALGYVRQGGMRGGRRGNGSRPPSGTGLEIRPPFPQGPMAGEVPPPPPDMMMAGEPPDDGGMHPPRGPGFMAGPPPFGPGPEAGGEARLLDVHGAGAQRSSPKAGEEALLPKGVGPQGDVLRINNFARCVRG